MSIRVIGGVYGGRTLDTPAGDKTHPMGERIRNAVFNSLGGTVEGVAVLDAFAGTGAVGIEALSRGAKTAVFIERDKIAKKCIQHNLTALGITNGQLVGTSVHNWLQHYAGPQFDIIFADPPYYDTQLATINQLQPLLAPGGTLVVSWPERAETPQLAGLALAFDRVYAGARIMMFTHA